MTAIILTSIQPFSAAFLQRLHAGIGRAEQEQRPFVAVGHQHWGCTGGANGAKFIGESSVLVVVLEVMSISNNGRVIVLHTAPASVTDIFEHAHIKFSSSALSTHDIIPGSKFTSH
jgi:hypothetical protein